MKTVMITLETLRGNKDYLKDGLEVAKRFDAEKIILADVIDSEEFDMMQTEEEEVIVDAKENRSYQLERVIERIEKNYDFQTVEKMVETGSPKRTLVEFVKNNEVDLLICGNNHYSNLEYALIGGSVAGYLAKHVTCNMMVLNNKMFDQK